MSNSFLDLNGLAHFKEKMDEQTNKQLANKANIDGYYETLAVGIAKNLEGRNDVTDSFMERTTGGDAEVANGAAQLTEVAGKSQVWNQLAKNGDFANGTADWNAISASIGISVIDGVLTCSAITSSSVLGPYQGAKIPAGHKLFYCFDVFAENACTARFGYTGAKSLVLSIYEPIPASTWKTCKNIVTTGSEGMDLLIIYGDIQTSTSGNTEIKLRKVNYIDLTLLGIDNLTTVAEVEAWLAENIGLREYYPYNPGTVLNSKMQGIESLGFNLLDPTTGKARIVGAYSDVYGNYYGITGTHGTLTFTSDLGETSEITPDSDGKFLLEEPGWLDVATPGADCAVFLWWDGTQTDYQPYERNTGDLDVTHIYGKLNGTGELVQVFPDGMAGVGTAKDVLRIEDGVTVARKRIGKRNIGDSDVQIESGCFKLTGLDRRYASKVYSILCDKYVTYTKGHSSGSNIESLSADKDKMIFVNSGSATIYIKDSDYSDVATFKSANSNVPLFYELATEQLYTDLVYQGSSLFADGTPVELPVNYRVNNWGIERMIPQNDSDVVTTFPELTCRYSIDAVEQLNTHTDEIEDLYEGLDELDEKKPNKSGSYPGMAVGSAKAIEGNDTKVEDFTFTPIQCADGLAQIKDVRGKSIVWNQLVQNGNFANGQQGWYAGSDVGFTVSDGVLTATKTGSSNATCVYTPCNMVSGHKYYISYILNSPQTGLKVGYAYSPTQFITVPDFEINKDVHISTFFVADSNKVRLYLGPYALTSGSYTLKNCMCIDLTLMFGAGNEPATVEEFEKMFPLPYYANNAGSLLNNKTEQIEVVGFNQWDEEYLRGTYNYADGETFTAGSNYICAKNKIPVVPGQYYYFNFVNSRLFYYDVNKNFVNSVTGFNLPIIIPNGIYYIRWHFAYASATYNHDICVNLSDPSRNGTYEPYKKDTVELNLPTLTGKLNGEGESVVVFPDGLKSAGTVYDEIVGNKAIKRIGVVDLGSLEWTLDNSIFKCTEVTDYRRPSDNSVAMLNQLNAKGYISKSAGEISTYDKIIAFGGTSYRIGIKDTTYNDAATFKTAMSGVLLYYELATPEEYILDTPIPATFQAYKGGTLKQLPENTSTPTTAPMVMENVYAIDVLSVIQSLPQNYISKESLQAMLTSMQSAGLFSAYTMTWDGSKYTFTFTANPTE